MTFKDGISTISQSSDSSASASFNLHQQQTAYTSMYPSWQAMNPNQYPISINTRFYPTRFPQFSNHAQNNSHKHVWYTQIPKKISLYKTELCRSYEETGYCRYGNKCQFAHDSSELRIVPRHPRYKTEICKTFWELGSCPYGKRCCFIHHEKNTDSIFSESTIQEKNNNSDDILRSALDIAADTGRFSELFSTMIPKRSYTLSRNIGNQQIQTFNYSTHERQFSRLFIHKDDDSTRKEKEIGHFSCTKI